MAIPYEYGTSFDTPRCIQCWKEYPFARFGDTSTTVYHHIMVVHGDVYAPIALDTTLTDASTKPLGSLFADDATAYFVEDRGLAPAGDNLVTFDRIFSNIPTDYEEGGGLYSFSFPTTAAKTEAYNCNNGSGAFVNRSGIVEMDFSFTAANALNFGVGTKIRSPSYPVRIVYYGEAGFSDVKPFFVIYEKTQSGGNYNYKSRMENYQSVKTITSLPGVTTFNILRVPVIGRASPTTINSESILTYRYVKTDDILSEKLEDRWKILTSAYAETDATSTTTYPSTKEYTGQTWAGGYVQAEPEVPTQWLGNIWEIVGRKVRLK